MKKFFLLISFLAVILSTKAQTVGIGTQTPDSTAILDISSTDKGVLIPRLADTANVTNPVEGLIIYNKNTRTPYYYDGKKWLSMGGGLTGSLPATTDRITYMVTGTGFSTTEETVASLTQNVNNSGITGGGNISKPEFPDFIFTKKADINSKSFNLAAVKLSAATIEFKVYALGAATPYISYKLKNIVLKTMKAAVTPGAPVMETVTFMFSDYGFKDWGTSGNYNYNLATGVFSAY
jgi:type VI protein secretion system component Hcp